MVSPTELRLNKAILFDTETLFLDLSIINSIVSSTVMINQIEIINLQFPNGDVPRSHSYGVDITQLIRFAIVCSNVNGFNRNRVLTAKLLKQGCRYHTLRRAFSKFYRRLSELIVKYNVGLKTLLHQGISEPVLFGDFAYKFKYLPFLDQFKKASCIIKGRV